MALKKLILFLLLKEDSTWHLFTYIFPFYHKIVCERSEVYALGCAIARSFPLYNRTSSPTFLLIKTVQVGFIFVGDDQRPLDDQELPALNESCEGKVLFCRTKF